MSLRLLFPLWTEWCSEFVVGPSSSRVVPVSGASDPSAAFDFTSGKRIEQKLLEYSQERKYFKQGKIEQFQQILEEGSSPEIDEYYADIKYKRIAILNALGAYYTHLGKVLLPFFCLLPQALPVTEQTLRAYSCVTDDLSGYAEARNKGVQRQTTINQIETHDKRVDMLPGLKVYRVQLTNKVPDTKYENRPTRSIDTECTTNQLDKQILNATTDQLGQQIRNATTDQLGQQILNATTDQLGQQIRM
ncbi:Protein CTR [Ananas comosus]|uniref:Protein CTR n=1 Tax=Ananas comosus TaxID=4615 RepID=A0A199V1M4_ANACO|nr:Protein CTR [Ananas comosus]